MSLSTLLVLADGRLPAGTHAHSGGVEAAVAAGRVHDVPTLESFLVGRTATTGVVAAAFAAATCRALNGGAPRPSTDPPRGDTGPDGFGGSRAPLPSGDPTDPGAGRVAALDDGVDVRTASPALRAASRAQGRALLRAAARIWPAGSRPIGASPHHPIATGIAAGPGPPEGALVAVQGRLAGAGPHHPIATGIAAAAAGLGPPEAALVAVYGGLTGAASAAVRLLGLDPFAVHALVARLAPDCDRVAQDAAARADDPVDDLPAGSAILLDVDAEQHATWEVRLFAS